MKIFIGGETGWSYFERMAYDGVIGIFYNTTLGGIMAYVIVIALVIFAAIGFFTVIKHIFTGGKKKEDPGKKWLRTGKF